VPISKVALVGVVVERQKIKLVRIRDVLCQIGSRTRKSAIEIGNGFLLSAEAFGPDLIE
jgi:hypothetical protein